MGYQQKTINGGNSFTWLTSTLPQVGASLEEQALKAFALPTDAGFLSGDSIVLSIYGADGALEGEYSFLDEGNAATWGLTKTGWYPYEKIINWEATDDDNADNTVIPHGRGVVIMSGEDDTTVTFAGEVLDQSTTITVNGNNAFTWTGNATPVDLTLGDFALPVDAGFLSGDSIVLSTYGADGALEGEYSFLDEGNAATWGLTKTGWYPYEKIINWEATDDDCANDVSVPAGKMTIIMSGEADATLTIPSAL